MSDKLIHQLTLSNDSSFMGSCIHLYNEIMSEYYFKNNACEKILVSKNLNNNFSILDCCKDMSFFYNDYEILEKKLYNVLKTNNIICNEEKNVSIEFIYGKSHNDIIVDNNFTIHKDIGSTISGESYTVIVYLHTNCQGGELIFYEDTLCSYEKTMVIDPNSYFPSFTKIVIFDGELFHKPEPFYNGKRCAIVCQISK